MTDVEFIGKSMTFRKDVNDHWSGMFTFPNGYAVSFSIGDGASDRRNYKSIIKDEVSSRVIELAKVNGWNIQPKVDN